MRQPGIFGQMVWDTYTLVLFGFRTPSDTKQDAITTALDQAALKLFEAYPFLAGQVIKEGRSSTNSGTYRIVPYAPHQGKSPVRPKDCTELCPSYDEIVSADAPFSLLDGEVLSPMKGMGYAYPEGTVMPVFIVQANFIRGGVLICFASAHNALDMNGQGVVIRQFATALRGEDFDPTLVAAGNQDADGIVPPLKEGEIALGHEELLQASSLNAAGGPPPGQPGDAPWRYWRVPQEKVVELKKLASESSNRVSTNDSVTAFFLQRLTAVRIKGGRVDKAENVQCLRAVDGRKMLKPPVPEGYLGHLVGLASTALPAEQVQTNPVSYVASALRESLLKVDDHYIRSLATLISRTEDKTTIFYPAQCQPGKDVLISSWAQMSLAHCDFGPLLGTPDFIRRPRLVEVPDLAYVMPRTKKGDLDLAASLRNVDVQGLQEDEVWNSYVQLIG